MITSSHNQHVAFCRSLHRARSRQEAGAYLVEGLRLAREALDAGTQPALILYDPDALDRSELGRRLLHRVAGQAEAFDCTSNVIAAAAETRTPQGLVMVAREPEQPPLSSIDRPDLVLILDGISDAGNAGTILRSAAAAGLDLVVFAGSTVDPFLGKVVRAGMGAHFFLRILRAGWSDLDPHLEGFVQVVGADAAGDRTIYDVAWGPRTALVIGSEAGGLTNDARSRLTATARVPMARGVESLNAAVVASIILFHAMRSLLG